MLTSAARRVRKEDVKPQQECDGLERCLDAWVQAMARKDLDMGIKSMTLVGDGGGDEATEAARYMSVIAKATNAKIDSLPKNQWWAIRKFCKISTVWNFPNANYAEVLEAAKENLANKLKKNLATTHLFR